MPINVFGNSSNSSDIKIDTALFVQKPYLRSNYIESNIEEDIDLKNQFRIENLLDPISIREACSKKYDDILIKDPSIIRNTTHIDLNDKNITTARLIQVNHLPQIDSCLTAKLYVDNAISYWLDDMSLLRLDPDEKIKLDEQDSIILNSTLISPNTIIELPTKAFIDSLHDRNERSRRDLGLDFGNKSNNWVKNNEINNFNDNKLTNIDFLKITENLLQITK